LGRLVTHSVLLRQITWWALAFPLVMVVALVMHSVVLLNWIHILSGSLWTGADIVMGFILGPVIRRLDIPARSALISFLVPRQLLYFPCVSLTTGTAGWYLASWTGLISSGAQVPWVIAALVLVTAMTVQGLGILLPNGLRIYNELRKPEPNRERIMRLNRTIIRVTGLQGLMQVAIYVVMAHFVLP
jgi:hypothetical protein